MKRKEFKAIDDFPWVDWMKWMRRRQGFRNRWDFAKLAGVRPTRYDWWEGGREDMLDIEELSSVLQVLGFRFTVMCGSVLDADFFEKAIREGIRPFEEDPLIVKGSITNSRTFIYQIRRAKKVFAADFDRMFDLNPRTFHRYERDELNRIHFKTYLKALTYLDVSWQFVRGSVIVHGNPQHFGIEHFHPNEYTINRKGPTKNF